MRQARAAAATVFRSADLRAVVGAYALFIASEYSAWIAILVWAYGQGGSFAAGVIALAQLVPAAIAAPLVASLADRRSPAAVLIGGFAFQAVALAATAAAMAADAPVLVWLCAILASTTVVTTRPALAALLPALVHRVEELGATNATLGWVDSSGVVIAGVATGVVLGASGTAAGVGVAAGLAAAAAAASFRVRRTKKLGAEDEAPPFGEQLRGGLAAVGANGAARTLLGLQTATWVVVGSLDILFVVLAIRVLHDGPGWVGYLNTAYGAGGLVGGVIAAALIGARRLALPILGSGALLGAALAAVAISSSTAAAALLLALVGGARLFLDVATRTLLQRIVPADVLGRVFGLVEGFSMVGLALGSVLAPLLVWAAGPKGAFVGLALVLPIVAIVAGRRILLLDRTARVPVVEIALLRSIPIFRSLPAPSLETAAAALVPTEVAAGMTLIEEGDPDAAHYFAICSGEVEVSRGGHVVTRVGRGDGVGEMALLRPIPRTATVTAVSDVLAYALDRESFLVAVTGHARTTTAADSVITSRFEELRELGLVANED